MMIDSWDCVILSRVANSSYGNRLSCVEVGAIPGLKIETWGTHFRTGSSGQRPLT